MRCSDTVCDRCRLRTRCLHDLAVTGFNTAWNGGFEARHDDDGICAETTATGFATVDGEDVIMGEARFGGIVISTPRPPRG